MPAATSKDRIGRFARAALKQALGVVTGDRRLEAEGAAERTAAEDAEDAGDAGGAKAGRAGGEAAAGAHRRGARTPAETRDAR